MTRSVFCPACGRTDAPLSWTGRIKLHVGRSIGDRVFCRGGAR